MASREKATVELYTTTRIETLSQFKKLWQLFSKEPVSARRFGGAERNLVDFRPGDAALAFEYLRRDALFVRGSDGFLGYIRPRWGGFIRWSFWLSAQALGGKKGAQWIDWFGEVCTLFPMLYGMIESISEHDSKHDTPATQPSGVSDAAFYEYLPGVYWLNIFGKELVAGFGREKLRSLPGTEVRPFGEHLFVKLDEPIVPDDPDRRHAKERDIMRLLGQEFFFEKGVPLEGRRQVPELLAVLKTALDEPESLP